MGITRPVVTAANICATVVAMNSAGTVKVVVPRMTVTTIAVSLARRDTTVVADIPQIGHVFTIGVSGRLRGRLKVTTVARF
jgi:hypothetical protein